MGSAHKVPLSNVNPTKHIARMIQHPSSTPWSQGRRVGLRRAAVCGASRPTIVATPTPAQTSLRRALAAATGSGLATSSSSAPLAPTACRLSAAPWVVAFGNTLPHAREQTHARTGLRCRGARGGGETASGGRAPVLATCRNAAVSTRAPSPTAAQSTRCSSRRSAAFRRTSACPSCSIKEREHLSEHVSCPQSRRACREQMPWCMLHRSCCMSPPGMWSSVQHVGAMRWSGVFLQLRWARLGLSGRAAWRGLR